MREISAFVCELLLQRAAALEEEEDGAAELELLKKYLKTATDVLRLACEASSGDGSLARPCKFRKFNRKERRLLLAVLNSCSSIEEDMLRYREQWLRLGERLHPGEYKRFANSYKAFDKVRNKGDIFRFNSLADKYSKAVELDKLLSLYIKRPGEFARKLDYLVRSFYETDKIIKAFGQVAEEVSVPVLLQVRIHFLRRLEAEKEFRSFLPKGKLARAHIEPNIRMPIEAKDCEEISEICRKTLISQFGSRESLGKVYLSQEYKDYLVPFSQRSASKALKTIVRGSKLSMPEDITTIRSFIYWKDGKERTDIDLSAVVYTESFRYMEHISFTRLKSNSLRACHSGDIVSAPKGACEFIDIDLASADQIGARYIVFTVNSYTMQPYCDLPECFVGFMERKEGISKKELEEGFKNANKGNVFEPKTVKNKIDLTTDTQICIPMLLDVKERKVIWMDMALKTMPGFNCVENNSTGIVASCQAIMCLEKPSLHDLMILHIEARGELTDSKEEADLIFDVEEGITPFDTEVFLAQYL